MYISTEKETNLVTSNVWGNGTVLSHEVRNGVSVLKVNFSDGWRELNYDYYHKKGMISYALIQDDKQKVSKQQECVNYLKNRNARYLVHFTPIENLKYIFDEGICPRTEQYHDAEWTDLYRLDGHTDCSCFSISYPNYSMLYQKRKTNGMNRFAILLIDCEALLEFGGDDVAYYPTNAAEFRYQTSSFAAHTGLQALREMFADEVVSKGMRIMRSEQDITDEYTTHPQAELLVKGIIPAKYIRSMVLYDYSTMHYIPQNIQKTTKVICNSDMFWPVGMWIGYENRRRAG